LEVTTLLIPGSNDSADEIAKMCDWFLEHWALMSHYILRPSILTIDC